MWVCYARGSITGGPQKLRDRITAAASVLVAQLYIRKETRPPALKGRRSIYIGRMQGWKRRAAASHETKERRKCRNREAAELVLEEPYK